MSDNNDAIFDVYDQDAQEGNDLQENGHQIENQNSDDPEFTAIKNRVKEMEEEAAKLKQLQTEMEQQMQLLNPQQNAHLSAEERMEADQRSIYVGNVDYSSTAQELEAHFHGCGSINRVTILCDKFSGHPKGFAYVEFVDKDSVQTAMALDDSLFKGRQIKVSCKRTNKPGISSTDRAPRGGFARGGGGGGGSGGFHGGRGGRGGAIRGAAYNPYLSGFRGRAPRGFRGRGFYYYSPY